MMRILLLGRDGQLGQDLQLRLAGQEEIKIICCGRDTLDLENAASIRQMVRQVQPDIIINAAAYTAVDRAESEPERAIAINGTAPTILAEEAQKLGAALLHVSTDYVFDGQKNTPYLEDDDPYPVGAYGQSKWLGEKGIRQSCDRYVILRTAWVYGVGGKGSFVKTMLRLGADREELRVVIDQVGSPTWTGDLAGAIAQFIPHLCPATDTQSPITGIYHFTNSGAISWYDFAVAIFEEATTLGFPLKLQRVVPITTAEYPTPASRPAYSVLSNKKTSTLLGSYAPHWRQGLRQMLKQLAAPQSKSI
jgi:dTDP-4-dehydrorhamnose reductase